MNPIAFPIPSHPAMPEYLYLQELPEHLEIIARDLRDSLTDDKERLCAHLLGALIDRVKPHLTLADILRGLGEYIHCDPSLNLKNLWIEIGDKPLHLADTLTQLGYGLDKARFSGWIESLPELQIAASGGHLIALEKKPCKGGWTIKLVFATNAIALLLTKLLTEKRELLEAAAAMEGVQSLAIASPEQIFGEFDFPTDPLVSCPRE